MMKLNKNTIASDIWTRQPELLSIFWSHGVFAAGAPYLDGMTISEVCDRFGGEPQALLLSLAKNISF